MSRRRWWRLGLVAAFVGMPLLEIYVLVQVGQVIGAWWTIGLLVVMSVLGTILVRREGGRAWRALTEALRTGRMPARELADGALILVGGTLLLAPGFVTDAFGIVLIVPLTRPVARRLLTGVLARRLLPTGASGAPGANARRPGRTGGPVVRGEVVDEPD